MHIDIGTKCKLHYRLSSTGTLRPTYSHKRNIDLHIKKSKAKAVIIINKNHKYELFSNKL